MSLVKTELYLRTCLRPCAGLNMTPGGLVEAAERLGAGAAGGAGRPGGDHQRGGPPAGPVRGPACGPDHAGLVYSHLQAGVNNPKIFGYQIIVNADDEVEEFCPRSLIGATDLPVHNLVRRIHGLDGLAVAPATWTGPSSAWSGSWA